MLPHWLVAAAVLAAGPADSKPTGPLKLGATGGLPASARSERDETRVDKPPVAPIQLSASFSQRAATPRELRDATSDALVREATTEGAPHKTALYDLVTIYGQLQRDSQLPDRERNDRLAQVRARLARAAGELEGQAADPAGNRPAARGRQAGARNAQAPARNARGAGNAARQAGNGGFAGRAAATAGAPDTQGAADLIELIQNTIAPDSWEARGGRGTIMYFPPRQVLVIRQTGEVHEQFQDLVRQLRR
jgi:hypothetical protein